MGSVKYKYNPFTAWVTLAIPLFGILGAVFLATGGLKGYDFLAPVLLFLICCIAMYYLSRKFFLPYRRGENILELDDEKLQYFFSNKATLWQDIYQINCGYNRNGLEIRIELKSGSSDDFSINASYIVGNDKAIYDTIMQYFEKYRTDS